MVAATAEQMQKHVRTYMMVFAALAILTVSTVAASWLHLPSIALTVAIAMLIACIKGTLVACHFMHLISERKALYTVLVLCVFLFFMLLFIPTMTSTETEAIKNVLA